MQIESMVFVGWAAVPLVAYVLGRLAIRRSRVRSADRPQTDALTRLTEMRERALDGVVTRGRMVEAIRLAEGPAGPPALTTPRG